MVAPLAIGASVMALTAGTANYLSARNEASRFDKIADQAMMLYEGDLIYNGSFGDIKKSSHPFIQTFFLKGINNDK